MEVCPQDLRLDKLRSAMGERSLEALLVSHPANCRYLSGFTGSPGTLLVTEGDAYLLTDFRYLEQAAIEAPVCRIERVGKRQGETLGRMARENGLERIAFEKDSLTFGGWERLKEALPEVELVPTRGIVESLRAAKEPAEIEKIEHAVEVAEEAFQAALNEIRPVLRHGVTEREAAWMIEQEMRGLGATRPSFDLIAASGPNSARPHARPSDRRFQAGDLVVFDLGAVVDGYCSDLTRTAVVGRPDPRQEEIHDLVLRAQAEAFKGLRAGISGGQADALARRVIADAGKAEAFGHGLGHGVGLEVHEEPRLAEDVEEPLPAGCVVSVEPGVYLGGWGGVRIEDLVVLTEGGCRILGSLDRDLMVLDY